MQSFLSSPALRWRCFKHQRYVVAQTGTDPLLVWTNGEVEGAGRPFLGHEHVVDVIAVDCPAAPVERRLGLVSGLDTARDVVGADKPEARQGTDLVRMVHPPSGPIPLHVIVEVTRDHGWGRTQKPAVAPKSLLKESGIVLLPIALTGVLSPDAEQVNGLVEARQPADPDRRHPVQATVMAMSVELQAGRAESGQQEPLVRINEKTGHVDRANRP